MARFLSPKELHGATVYDSLGLTYGVFRGIRVEGGTVLLEVVLTGRAQERIVDEARLRSMLGMEGTVEELVAEARRRGLDVPYKLADRGVEMLKGLVPAEEVAVADSDDESGLKAIVLSTPREARYRGLPVEGGRPRVLEEDRIRGKPIISLSRGILGVVEGYVIGAGGPGVRAVKSLGEEGYINWLGFTSAVKAVDRGLYERLASMYNPLENTRLPLGVLGRVKEVLGGRLEEVLDRYIVYRPRRGGVDVPWSQVLAVGDAVLVD